MLKDNWLLISRLSKLVDNIIVVSCFFVAYHFREELLGAFLSQTVAQQILSSPLGTIENYFLVLGIALPMFNAALSFLGAYQRMRFLSLWSLLRICILSSLLAFVGIASALYILKLDTSRSFVSLFCSLSALALILERVATLLILRYLRKRGLNFRNLLVVGTGSLARRLYMEITSQPELGVRVVGFVDRGMDCLEESHDIAFNSGVSVASVTRLEGPLVLPAPVICGPDGFESALKKHAVDEVLFAQAKDDFGLTRELAEIAAEEGVRVSLAADFFGVDIKKSELSFLGGVPLIHYHHAPTAFSALFFKRCIDLIVSVFLLLILAPFLLTIALLIKLDSKGPALFKQERVGLNGRIFVLLKFRSMVENAEDMLIDLLPLNEMQGPAFKLKNDPRITRVGRWLRKYSIDELPQLINVLKGDMSLVGPRPPLPEEVLSYRRAQRRRLSMRPGITCTWQIGGRNDIPDFEDWAKLDLAYIDNWSLWNDIKILLRTAPVVLLGRGAR